MTHQRLSELLRAIPELTQREVNRLANFQPKLSMTWIAVQFALHDQSFKHCSNGSG